VVALGVVLVSLSGTRQKLDGGVLAAYLAVGAGAVVGVSLVVRHCQWWFVQFWSCY
jgi:hypothetical protein